MACGGKWMRVVATAVGVLWCVCGSIGAWAGEDSCSDCHSYMSKESQTIVEQWKNSVHAKKGIGCTACHGGDSTTDDFDDAMWNASDFVGRPKRSDIPALCAKCHSDPAYMRPFNISSTSQYAEYKQSVHGKRLFEDGDTKVAVCTDCHGVHEIRATDDVLSSVYKTNIPQTCANCHANKEYMAPYDIPTNQYEDYKSSHHGRRLLEDQDTASPACSDCHGTHGATPPGVTEIANVCGTCHGQTLDYFNEGPHADALASVGAPRCVDCHGNHASVKPTDAMLLGSTQGHCGSCHAEGSAAYATAVEIHDQIVKLDKAHTDAISGLKRAEAANMDMEDQIAELASAKTNLVSARALQHTVTPEKVAEAVGAASETIDSINKATTSAMDTSHRRNKALLVTGILILLTSSVLYYKWRIVYQKWLSSGS